MDPNARWQRATMLFQQGRFDMAVTELRGLLVQAPDHAPAHALLAYALAQLDQLDPALAEAKLAVTTDPELPFAHGALATVLWRREEHAAAAHVIQRAIALDPDEPDHHSTHAQILLAQRRWAEALVAADTGLAIAPQDTNCLNLRAIALTKLGRGSEATDSVDAALAHDPDNPYTHQARGFALLNQGDAKGALHHFQEALRRDPTLDGSRQGLVEALKARNPLYRVVLGWFLWLDRFSHGKQRQILIGAWLAAMIGSRVLRSAGHATAGDIVSFSWLGFVLLSACTVPIFNLLLLLHPLGRHALDRQSRNDAVLLGLAVLCLVGIGAHAWLGDSPWARRSWLFWLVFLLPVSGIGVFHSGWARRVLQAFCVGAVGVWLWWAIRLEALIAAVESAKWRSAGLPPALRDHLDLMFPMLTAVAFSTWFVLLAPKGRPKRQRG